ncbi:MAG: general secretion pathway protein F [Hyphomicrobiaceae bacterium]|jgi:general secretion pathway protein F
MPAYRYRGIAASGRAAQGTIEADSARGARGRLRERDIFASEIELLQGTSVGSKPSPGAGRRMSAADLSRLLRQLAVLLRAGVPLAEAVASLGRQHRGGATAETMEALRSHLLEGSSLAAAMERHPLVFPEMYVRMVAAGESSGALETVLDRCASHAESTAALVRRARTAITYPAVMGVVGGGIVMFLLAYVVPQVTRVFSDAQQELPWVTRALMWVGSFLSTWGLPLAALAVGAGFGLRAWSRKPQGAAALERALARVPWLGPLLNRVAVARFAQTLSTMVAGGLPLVEALRVARQATGSVTLEAELERAEEAVIGGESLAAHLEASHLFDPMVVDMIAVGERSGDLEGMLSRASEAIDEQVRDRIDIAAALLEPAMIVFMAGIVLFVVLAIMLPVFEMNQLVR